MPQAAAYMSPSYWKTFSQPQSSPANPAMAAQELVCRERPQRGCLRARRVPEECPASVSALIDACIEGANPALRPSAYEAFQCLAARCGLAHLMLRSNGKAQPRTAALSLYSGACQDRAWY